ncbi:hypothetical protein TNCV_3037241 [Trichonephila clavipes]|nr:hypothetical protein TNCV_3037241 [Trichonephila clavipes]
MTNELTFPNYPTTPMLDFELKKFNVHQIHLNKGSSVAPGLEPAIRRSRVRDLFLSLHDTRDDLTAQIVVTSADIASTCLNASDNPLLVGGACAMAIVFQVIYSQFGLAIHQNDNQARRRFVEWAQNEIAVVPDFSKRILYSDETQFWLNGYVNKQNCRIWSEANPQVYVETPLHPEKLTVWCALWAGGILLQKR